MSQFTVAHEPRRHQFISEAHYLQAKQDWENQGRRPLPVGKKKMATKYDRDEDYLHTLKLAKARGESVDDLIAIERKEKALRSGKKKMALKKRTRRPAKRRAHKIHTGGMPSSHVAHAKHGKKRRAKKARKTTAKRVHAKRSTKRAHSKKSSTTKVRYFNTKKGETYCLSKC